jgi:hypothetical protein
VGRVIYNIIPYDSLVRGWVGGMNYCACFVGVLGVILYSLKRGLGCRGPLAGEMGRNLFGIDINFHCVCFCLMCVVSSKSRARRDGLAET